ncbi:hypothetical protein LCGC14_2745100 [marine sediment metagenome]|uniref:Uncharacterized protein n=1 Tax=marine sediment metagenome TaxID=412755 RepID=A0A0F8Z3A8_9ZZZZ
MVATITERWYWFSFSFKGEHQGSCNVRADTPEAALQRTTDLGIQPKHDDVLCFEIPYAEITADKLLTKQELKALNYQNIRSLKS